MVEIFCQEFSSSKENYYSFFYSERWLNLGNWEQKQKQPGKYIWKCNRNEIFK